MSSGMTVLRVPAHPGATPERAAVSGPAANLDEMWQQLPVGAYTTLRTFGARRLLRINEHFTRLENSARLAGFPLAFDRVLVRRTIATLLPVAESVEARVRLLLAYAPPGEVFIGVEPLAVQDPRKYEDGVRCVTCSLTRPNPRSKSSAFIAAARELRAGLPGGIEDAIMTGFSGEMLEGLSSNFFGWRDGALWTAGGGMLEGITRAIVLEQALAAGWTVRLAPVRCADLGALEEAFITSSTRGVMPVVTIDDVTIGTGAPGPQAREMRARYDAQVESEAETP